MQTAFRAVRRNALPKRKARAIQAKPYNSILITLQAGCCKSHFGCASAVLTFDSQRGAGLALADLVGRLDGVLGRVGRLGLYQCERVRVSVGLGGKLGRHLAVLVPRHCRFGVPDNLGAEDGTVSLANRDALERLEDLRGLLLARLDLWPEYFQSQRTPKSDHATETKSLTLTVIVMLASPSRFFATTVYVPSWVRAILEMRTTLEYECMSESMDTVTFLSVVSSLPLKNHVTSGSGIATSLHSRSTSSPTGTHLALGFRENVGGIPSRMSARDDSLLHE